MFCVVVVAFVFIVLFVVCYVQNKIQLRYLFNILNLLSIESDPIDPFVDHIESDPIDSCGFLLVYQNEKTHIDKKQYCCTSYLIRFICIPIGQCNSIY